MTWSLPIRSAGRAWRISES